MSWTLSSTGRLITALCAIINGPWAAAQIHRQDSAPPIVPDIASAEANAAHIFNAIHSAGRQWGSSLNHNGFGFVPAVVPAGTLLYHGDWSSKTPESFEWLAFEIEHAEDFGRSIRFPLPPPQSAADDGDKTTLFQRGDQLPLEGKVPTQDGRQRADNDEPQAYLRGFLQTYQANRDLRLLYVDGMSAGKSSFGTLDSQDYVLRGKLLGNHSDSLYRLDHERADEICNLITQWDLDGYVRMEIGVEIVYCDFSAGLDVVSITRSFVPGDMIKAVSNVWLAWSRAVANNYDGIVGNRLRIDFSSMVSGFYFPISINSTDPWRPDRIRLAAANSKHLKDIKEYVRGIALQPRSFAVDWQAAVDMIVTRFWERFAFMVDAQKCGLTRFIQELELAILLYIDAPPSPKDIELGPRGEKNKTQEAIESCYAHYVRPVSLRKDHWNFTDELNYAAVSAVTKDICDTLFTTRAIFLNASSSDPDRAYRITTDEADPGEMAKAYETGFKMVTQLYERLGWTIWKKARPCGVDEVNFVAMWPLGDVRDHESPGCRGLSDFDAMGASYWGHTNFAEA